MLEFETGSLVKAEKDLAKIASEQRIPLGLRRICAAEASALANEALRFAAFFESRKAAIEELKTVELMWTSEFQNEHDDLPLSWLWDFHSFRRRIAKGAVLTTEEEGKLLEVCNVYNQRTSCSEHTKQTSDMYQRPLSAIKSTKVSTLLFGRVLLSICFLFTFGTKEGNTGRTKSE